MNNLICTAWEYDNPDPPKAENLPQQSEKAGKKHLKAVTQDTEKARKLSADTKTRKDKKTKEPVMDDKNLIAAFAALSKTEQEQLETLLKSKPEKRRQAFVALSEIFDEKVQPVPFETIAANYKPFPVDQEMTVEAITAHLEDKLKDYLTHFGASVNSIFLYQFKKIEPEWKSMYDKLRYRHNNDPSSPELTRIIPRKFSEVTKIKRSEIKSREEKEKSPHAAIG